jgi:hypothetical protein
MEAVRLVDVTSLLSMELLDVVGGMAGPIDFGFVDMVGPTDSSSANGPEGGLVLMSSAPFCDELSCTEEIGGGNEGPI